MLKNALNGFAVAFAAAFGLSFLATISGSSTGFGSNLVMPALLGVLTFFALQMRSGNRKETRADDNVRQAALNATVPPGQALLFVYREGFVGKAVGWNVALDGAALAQLKSPRFTCTAIPPGRHTLAVSLGLGGFAGTQNTPSETLLEAQAGEVLVYAIKSKMGALSATLLLRERTRPARDPAEARQDPDGGQRASRIHGCGLIVKSYVSRLQRFAIGMGPGGRGGNVLFRNSEAGLFCQ